MNNGRIVVPALLGGVAVLAALSWKVALDVRAQVDADARAHGVREMSRLEAARKVAEDDHFGLPSRLEDAPHPAMERPFREATVNDPLPPTREGVGELIAIYADSVRGCRHFLPEPESAGESVDTYVTLVTVEGFGRVSAVDGPGEGVRTQAFTHCLDGALRPAIFEAVPDDELTLPMRVPLGG